MSNNKRSIEAIIAPPAPHMVGDGFGWTGFMKRAVQKNARKNLMKFMEREAVSN